MTHIPVMFSDYSTRHEASTLVLELLDSAEGSLSAFKALAENLELFRQAKHFFMDCCDYDALTHVPEDNVFLCSLIFDCTTTLMHCQEKFIQLLGNTQLSDIRYDPRFTQDDSFLFSLYGYLTRNDFQALRVFPLAEFPNLFTAVASILLEKNGIPEFARFVNSLRQTPAYDLGSDLDVWRACAGFIQGLPEAQQQAFQNHLKPTHKRAFLEMDVGL